MIYLASQSSRRRTLLRELGRAFRVVRSTYRETMRRGALPSVHVMRNAMHKARTARLPRGARGLVIGADTMLYVQGRLIGKPKTMRQAARLLLALGGRSHWVYTGLCVRAIATGQTRLSYEKTKVTFKPLTPALASRLVARMSPLDKAGGYALQEDRGELIARIDGSRSNVIGLPLERLRRELAIFEGQPPRNAGRGQALRLPLSRFFSAASSR